MGGGGGMRDRVREVGVGCQGCVTKMTGKGAVFMLPLSENVYVSCVGFTRRPSPGGEVAFPVFRAFCPPPGRKGSVA